MTPFVVGTPEDVAGFALAGIEGVVCRTRDEANQAIAKAGVDSLVLLSAELAREVVRDRLVVALPARS